MRTPSSLGTALFAAMLLASSGSQAADLVALASFSGPDGRTPYGGLVADAAGNLYGTTFQGGSTDYGTVFEIARTAGGYAGTPAKLVDFTYTNGATPTGSLLIDGAGNLFGTAGNGGSGFGGTLFEVAASGSGHASVPTTLANFQPATTGTNPFGGLLAGPGGIFFGVNTYGGPGGSGAAFVAINPGSGYVANPIAFFNTGTQGQNPQGALIADAAGNLYGATVAGGSNGTGTVFEIPYTSTGFAAPVTLAQLTGATAAKPAGGLVADAAGDLFGTTRAGGGSDAGTIFEIPCLGGGFAPLVTLATFNNANGWDPQGQLIIDAAGNLFGTTYWGGANGDGEVFELPLTPSGYAAAPTVLASFDGTNGSQPLAGLLADATGNLFGTASGGGGGGGTVFELSDSGYVTADETVPEPAAPGFIWLGLIAGMGALRPRRTALSSG